MLTAILASVFLANAGAAATDQEKDAVAEAYMACLLQSAQELDNGTSSEGPMAIGVAASCQGAFRDMKEVFSRGASGELKQMLSDRFDEMQRRSSARAVLLVRAVRQKSSSAEIGS